MGNETSIRDIFEIIILIWVFYKVMYYLSGAYKIDIPNKIDRDFRNQSRNVMQGRFIPMVDDKTNEWYLYDCKKGERVK